MRFLRRILKDLSPLTHGALMAPISSWNSWDGNWALISYYKFVWWNDSNFNRGALNLEIDIKAGLLYFNNDFSSNKGIPKWILPMCTYIFVVPSVISEILCSFGKISGPMEMKSPCSKQQHWRLKALAPVGNQMYGLLNLELKLRK